jgi:hypothetical protein
MRAAPRQHEAAPPTALHMEEANGVSMRAAIRVRKAALILHCTWGRQ